MSTPTPGLTPAPSPNAEPKTFREAIVDAAAAGVSSAPQSSNPKDPLVFLGFGQAPTTTPVGPYAPGYKPSVLTSGGGVTHETLRLSEVAAQYYTWDQKTKDKFLTQLALTGADVDNLPDAKIAQLWGAYAEQAAAYYSAGKAVTPWDILAKDREQREKAVLKPRTVTQTATNLDLSSALTARAIFQEATRALLGRAPTKAETRSFQSRLNAYERANPAVATTTSNYAGGTGDLVSQSTVSTGGVQAADRAMIAEESAKADPEYGAYQASTSGMNWLMEMVNGG